MNRSQSSPRTRRASLGLLLALPALLLTQANCGEEPTANPLSLRSPSRFVYAPQCVENGTWLDAATCPDAALVDEVAFVTNIESAALSWVEIDGGSARLRDLAGAVPGTTAMRIGERPQAAVATPDGAFVLTANTVSRDISVVEVARGRELTAFVTDEPGRALAIDPETGDLWVGYASGRLERRQLEFDCGNGPGIYVDGCSLDPSGVTLPVVDVLQAPGAVESLTLDPVRRRIYASYSDQLYVSAWGLEGTAETCTDGTTAPCEVDRLPGGYGCSDGIDNDGDGFVDGQDPQCYARNGAESPEGIGFFATTGCNDLIDGDEDGLLDTFDPGCESSSDASEDDGFQVFEPAACADGVDNDGDGLIDNRDPDCTSPDDDDESGPGLVAACTDGVDNDGDGLVDFPEDPDCVSAFDDTEDNTPGCSDGIDNDGDGLVDLDDDGCASPDDTTETPGSGPCADGRDNDEDGLVDLADPGCYGAGGSTENEVERIGLGPVGIDPDGRWLYVVDASEWQVLIVDIAAGEIIDAGARNPYSSIPGVRVNPVPRAVAGDVRSSIIVETDGGVQVERDEAVAYVATTAGTLDIVSVHQTFRPLVNGEPAGDELDTFTLRIGDTAGESVASAINVRCVGQICADEVLPTIDVRRRPTVLVTAEGVLQATDPETGKPPTTPADDIFVEERWQIVFEGVLPGAERTDGVLVSGEPGRLGFGGNFCTLGVRPGDRLAITSPVSQSAADDPTCQALSSFRTTNGLPPEWEVASVRSGSVQLALIDEDPDLPTVEVLPIRDCYPFGLAFEVRADDSWILVSELTASLHRQATRNGVCVERPNDGLGQGRLETGVPYQNGLFSLTIPESFPVARDAAIAFQVRDGYTPLRRSIGPLPGDVDVVQGAERKFLFVPDEGADQVFIFDADTLRSLESL